ncbi:MAG: lipoprotein LprG [Mycobacterium sp.]|nr:lipoprotein LprG [Mycobacterium sp.]
MSRAVLCDGAVTSGFAVGSMAPSTMQPMQTRRPILAVLAALSIAAALVGGCSSSKQSGAPLPDAPTLLSKSNLTTRNVKSVHLVLSVNGKIKHLPVKTLTGDLTTTPDTAAQGNASITFSGSDIDAQFVVDNGTLYAALSPGQWESFGPASAIYDPSEILNPNTGLANVLTNISNPKSQSRETINGQSTIKITGTASADAVNGLAPQLKATQPAPTTVWIEENGDHQLVQVQLEQTPGNSVQMTLSNWNAPVQVTKPPVAGG